MPIIMSYWITFAGLLARVNELSSEYVPLRDVHHGPEVDPRLPIDHVQFRILNVMGGKKTYETIRTRKNNSSDVLCWA